MYATDKLLPRLERVKEIGIGRWQACCPSHADGTPSLSIKEVSTGMILIHCHAGCSAEQIVSAVGLNIADLFPRRSSEYEGYTPKRRPKLITATQGLEICAKESLLISVIASDFAKSTVLSEKDRERLLLAAGRVCAVYSEVMR
jgi:hypothetical protein